MEREHFVAVMKRKDVKELGAIILREVYDEEESAKDLASAGRLTNALIERTCLEKVETEEDVEAEATVNEDEVEHSEPEAPVADIYTDIEKAIKKGKGKKALKLIKQAKADGHRGSVLNKLKEQAKSL